MIDPMENIRRKERDMGTSIPYTCGACGAVRDPFVGIGMAFPTVYRETMDEIRQGKHGEEWRSLVESGELIAVDAEDKLFVCSACGAWEAAPDLSLYEPVDVEKLLTKQYGIKTVAEWGEVPFVTSWELEEDFKLLRRREHRCPDCGGEMQPFVGEIEDAPKVKCPKCGGEMTAGDGPMILWD